MPARRHPRQSPAPKARAGRLWRPARPARRSCAEPHIDPASGGVPECRA
ncbi:hypothetical protein ATKI12_5006 [Kitasatospora sp. Ki12]